MITLITNIIMIMFILAYIIEQSGVTIYISKLTYKFVYKNKKWNGEIIKSPFTCLPCSTFWVILIYLLTLKGVLISLFIASLASILSKIPSILIEKIKITILKYK